MTRERVYRTRAIVLKGRDQGEADRILTMFTPQMGKRTLLARGIRKPASRKAGHLEPFTLVSLLLAKGRTWDLVTQAETVDSFRRLREDLNRAANAYYAVELIDAFTEEEDSHPEIFDLLQLMLERLEQTDQLELTMRWFELSLLRLSGYQPELFHCLECGEPLQPVTNYLSIERGGILCPQHGEGRRDCQPIDVGALKVLRYLISQPYAAIVQLDLAPARLGQIERILADYLQAVLERRLKSPHFIRSLRA